MKCHLGGNRLANYQSLGLWNVRETPRLEGVGIDEARRRLGLSAVDAAKAETNGKRLALGATPDTSGHAEKGYGIRLLMDGRRHATAIAG
jgi:hypothetical protein